MLKYWIWLSALHGIGAQAALKLLAYFETPDKIFFASEEELENAGMGEKELAALSDKSLDRTMEILDACADKEITVITINDAVYPERLKNIFDPPIVLYILGRMPAIDEEAAVAVAGTRSCTPYGLKNAERMGYELTRAGCLGVSGLAKGIDAAAAQGALRAGGRVIGVVGSGPDIIYPRENTRLFEDVLKNGCIISEYPPGTEVRPSHFPQRNRILSGLSVGVLIVEAPQKSGALITAAHALEQGRDVFALMANADAQSSYGSNKLIRDGAIPVMTGDDIAGEYTAIYPSRIHIGRKRLPLDKEGEKRLLKSQTEIPAKKGIDKPAAGDYDLKTAESALNDTEKTIVNVLKGGTLHLNDVIEKCALPAGSVMAALTMLEIKGVAIQEKGKFFKLKKRS